MPFDCRKITVLTRDAYYRASVAFQVPSADAELNDDHEELVEWLNSYPDDWDGDEYGISFKVGGRNYFARPGDYIRVDRVNGHTFLWHIPRKSLRPLKARGAYVSPDV